jgi:hypothetical protein
MRIILGPRITLGLNLKFETRDANLHDLQTLTGFENFRFNPTVRIVCVVGNPTNGATYFLQPFLLSGWINKQTRIINKQNYCRVLSIAESGWDLQCLQKLMNMVTNFE